MMDKVAEMSRAAVTLNNGSVMPLLGFGTYRLAPGEETWRSVADALHMGYRLIDTAAAYGNEGDVGAAIQDSGIERESIFVTTKLWNTDHGYKEARSGFEKSLKRLGLSCIDLFLVHWPAGGKLGETWRALSEFVREKRCRAIGVSNFTEAQIREVMEATEVLPAVNQIEYNVFVNPGALVDFCRQQGVQVEAYTPLAKGAGFDHPVLADTARKYEKTPAQIMLRWIVQQGIVAIPKAAGRRHREDNMHVFEFSLDEADMGELEALGRQ
jgi:diketogulonate reductase-like aldo/keto reductase